ncbi:MAG: hypothetical protein KIS92_06205 [Planctomycetota bacterium]|nr:hypothetical protein [Planctomycetota bacterium]
MRIGAFCAAAVLLLPFAGCGPATSANPITDPKASKRDQRLEGAWIFQSDDKKTIMHFTLRKEHEFRILVANNKGDAGDAVYDASSSEAGNRRFLNVRIRKVDEAGVRTVGDGHVLVWYEVSDEGVLKLRLSKSDGFAKAIDGEKLKGEVTRDKKKVLGVKVTDSSQNLAEYLAKSNLDDDFGDAVELKKLNEPDDDK